MTNETNFPKHQVGDWVKLENTFIEGIDDEDEFDPHTEYGIVIHTWHNEYFDMQECYVAFFGDKFPEGEPKEKPYILRYMASSLQPIKPKTNIYGLNNSADTSALVAAMVEAQKENK